MKKNLLLFTLCFLGLSQMAVGQATAQDSNVSTRSDETPSRISPGGFYIEPLLMATQSESSVKTSQLPLIGDDTSGKESGYGLGLRFGAHISEIVLLGVDARYAKTKMQDSSYGSANAESYNLAPVVGLQTPLFGIRLLGSYVVAGENNPESGTKGSYRDWETDRKSTRLNSSHSAKSRMPSSA